LEDGHGQDLVAVEKPNDRDILCGRGGLTNTHPGNAWFRTLVRANRPYYRSSPKHGKILVAKAIINHVFSQNPPCRFLEKSRDGAWFPVDRKRSVDKTSQALRERERHMDSPSQEEDTAALAEQMILLKNARANRTNDMHLPQLILPPQPDYEGLEVKRSQSDKSFALIADSVAVPDPSKKRKADVTLQRPVRGVAPSTTSPIVETAPTVSGNTNPDATTDMENEVTQISARFWKNSVAKGRVKRPAELPVHARQRALPSARSHPKLTSKVSLLSAMTPGSPGVE
jgi:hypothetical protein